MLTSYEVERIFYEKWYPGIPIEFIQNTIHVSPHYFYFFAITNGAIDLPVNRHFSNRFPARRQERTVGD